MADICKTITQSLTKLTEDLNITSKQDKKDLLSLVNSMTLVLDSALDDDIERLNKHTKEFVNG
jgi:hypothetical protein